MSLLLTQNGTVPGIIINNLNYQTAMKIYIVHVDLLDDIEKQFGELTDQEVIDLCEKDEDRENHRVYCSMEEFAADWNNDEMFYPSHSYMRVIKESFNISRLSREDLEAVGFDTSEVDDATMERLASKLGDDYCEQLFWTSLEILAECMDIPKKDSEDEEEEED